ncbi:outer membrane protein [Neorhizobium sp. JUb45]|uniref:outer membrane protein n=2 Tax=unclassified Neorhizobium TaxID=2629175 RepID=UPI001404BD97|nr:outer membrane protein [Neorhizobium sp. JUb45]
MTATSAARAADAVEQIPEAPVAIEATAPAFTWSGPYVGLHGGYGWGNGDVGAFSENFDGGRFGGFVGYNWQMSNGFVAGLEGDVNYDWNEQSIAGADVKSGFSGSARARLGYAMDRALPYIAGGWTATNAKVSGPVSDDDTLSGWTIGAGVDYAFTDNIFGRAEYRYNDYGSGNLAGANVNFDQHIVNVGIGVKF